MSDRRLARDFSDGFGNSEVASSAVRKRLVVASPELLDYRCAWAKGTPFKMTWLI